jgi:glutamyl-tRNA(Gln) amidotransferase subunit D
MSYSSRVLELLRKIGAEEGDSLSIRSGGREYRGILMPHHEFSHPDVIVIKLSNGYNIGLRMENVEEILVNEKPAKRGIAERVPIPPKEGKEVAIIGTGGTIASYVDYRTGGVHPALSAADLVSAVPEITDICSIRAEVLFSIFSENIDVKAWQRLARAVADHIENGAEGVIIPHGTDTMGYTSAALAFMLEELPRPVILVGAQRSSDRPSSDAYTNLLSAVRFVVESDLAEVCVLMHESTSDTSALVHRGTRVRKLHTSRRDAFTSVNQRPLARVNFEGSIDFLSPYRKKSSIRLRLRDEMEEEVALLLFYPGMSADKFERIVMEHRGLVVAGSGLGHVSASMVKVLARAVESDIPVVMTSQCLYGRINLSVYDTGRDLITAGVIPVEDMLPETAYVKLMWVMGQTSSMPEVRKLMLTDLRGEISERRELDE